MDFRLSAEQQALQEGIRSFCEARVPRDALRRLEDVQGFDRTLWKELADMGVFAARLPSAAGGLGLGAADAVVIFVELGRALVPGPVLWSHLAASLIDGASTGDVVVGGLDLGETAASPYAIEHHAALDVLLCVRADGVYRIDPQQISAEPVAVPFDPLTPIHHAAALPAGARIAGADAARALRLDGTALVAAQMLGIAETTLVLAVAYAKAREQFGRPIGSFQAIKHMLADMFVRQEVARAAVYAAGATIDTPEVGDPWRAVAAAKVTAAEAALRNARACIQIHGGMGYTWEVPAHYYLKRTWVLENTFGTTDAHADRLAEQVAS
jgi:alkylation response protein AidB-like acyl-CoA dehydrogenase